jgi:hypothetical protein
MRVLEALVRSAAGVVRALGVPALAVAIVLALFEGIGAAELGGRTWLVPAVFVALAVVHEWGHVLAAGAAGARIEGVARSGSGIYVRYRGIGDRGHRAVVLAGPTAAVLGAVVLLAVLGLTLVTVSALVIAAGHVVSLAVPVGDGAELRRAMSAGS